ncbi:hypothetical protein [Micromonospora sp. KC721]|uniref:hypothetical protein n=1 Tax=Micromonospora sp. KC721 TaxID=2530380 RepID=UPI00104D4561|nr:hypothetical protein [Micromonospora sp. KC721]TDB72085.1 hypothetical protein E1182_23790 [Micromonospora sp. KC721]
MTDDRTSQQDQHQIDTPNVPIAPTITPFVYLDGFEIDNINKAHKPTHLTPAPGGAGATTEWDAASLDDAIRWLNEHAEFLNSQSYRMEEDIRQWMRNPSGAGGIGAADGKSPLGSFERANALAQRHAGLYDSTQTALRGLAEDLWNAAKALQKVKDDYETAEGANKMTADQMAQALGNGTAG